MPPKLSIVIPAYNEEKRIAPTLDLIFSYIDSRGFDAEVLVVNDGSSDKTAEIVNAYDRPNIRLVNNPGNRGKGYTVRHGFMEAVGDYILFTDADGSTPIEMMDRFWPEFEKGCDIAIGSRALKTSEIAVRQPWYRENMGRVFNKIVQLIAIWGIKDTQCGFKCFTREAARAVFPYQRIDGWAFDVEILHIARRYGCKISEVPVKWINSEETKINPFGDAAKMFLEVFKVRVNAIKGVYKTPREDSR